MSSSFLGTLLTGLKYDIEVAAIPSLQTFFTAVTNNSKQPPLLQPASDAIALIQLKQSLIADVPGLDTQVTTQLDGAIQAKLQSWLTSAQAGIANAGAQSSTSVSAGSSQAAAELAKLKAP